MLGCPNYGRGNGAHPHLRLRCATLARDRLGHRPGRGRRPRLPRAHRGRRRAGPDRGSEWLAQPRHGRLRLRGAGAPRGARGDPRPRRGARACLRGATRDAAPGRASAPAVSLLATIATWFAAVWVLGELGGRRAQRAGRDRAAGRRRAAVGHELVPAPRVLDRLDDPPPQPPAAAARRARRPAAQRGARLRPARLHARSTARASRSCSSCSACACAPARESCSRASRSAPLMTWRSGS